MSTRFGIKGSDAPAFVQHLGLPVPTQPNRMTHWQAHDPWGSGRCLRQGNTEFLIELDTADRTAPPADAAFPNAWTLIRSDHSLVLRGDNWPRDLAQICSFDFTQLIDAPDLVVMTTMAGIGVTLIREPSDTASDFALRLWCDASFSTYLQECLNTLRGPR
jgi:sarcosine oxidase subunit gamma